MKKGCPEQAAPSLITGRVRPLPGETSGGGAVGRGFEDGLNLLHDTREGLGVVEGDGGQHLASPLNATALSEDGL